MKKIIKAGLMYKMELDNGGEVLFRPCLLSDVKQARDVLFLLDDSAITLQAVKSVSHDMRSKEVRLIRKITTKALVDFLGKHVQNDCSLSDFSGEEIAILLLAIMGVPSKMYEMEA